MLPIEHRMFCHISENWRGRPLESRAVAVNLIANTHPEKGLTVDAEIDDAFYATSIRIPDEDMAKLGRVHKINHRSIMTMSARVTKARKLLLSFS
jgi:hypothetical protein